MKHAKKRILSLLMSGVMTASMLPAYLTELPIPAAADDPPLSQGDELGVGDMEDTSPTIDFDYGNDPNNPILNADDALRDLAQKGKSYNSTGLYNRFPWRHATNITANAHSEGSIHTLLESTDPNDKYVALSSGDNETWTYWKNHKWETIRITTNKVLDLNGKQLLIHYNANVNHDEDEGQEYRWKDAHYLTVFEIDKGATLTIIDSSAWRDPNGKGSGMIAFTAGWADHFDNDYKWYGHRDLFHVMDGNLIIYGGTYQAGNTKVQTKEVSNFTWGRLKSAIGTAVTLGCNIAKYATGISTAEAAYKDVLKDVADMSAGTANPAPLKTDETQKKQPDGKNSTRNQSVSEKAAEKDSKIASGKDQGTPEGENQADSEGKAKNDTNTRVAQAKADIVSKAANKDDISGMVNDALSLVDNIVELCGTKNYPPISNTIMGTVVRVGTGGTFASYGGTYIGNGSTPDTRNAVVEVVVEPKEWPQDHSKMNGGKAYIYDGEFVAHAGANVFNICRGLDENEVLSGNQYMDFTNGAGGTDSDGRSSGKYAFPITYDEHYGVEELFYENQRALDTATVGNDGKFYSGDTEIIPKPITTANIQVRGGTFRCDYNVMNMAKLEAGAAELDYTAEPHYRKFPGTSGSVNLGVDSFGADLIRDGRIQLVDNAAGCLVLMDDQKEGKNGLYHYRLYCGDTELRTKSNLKVYPNTATTNASYSMQLAYYLGTGSQTEELFKDDENGDNIRSPYRQMENYFDFQIDDKTHRSAYSVKPNFHHPEYSDNGNNNSSIAAQMDVYGEKTASSEVWYYPTPLDKDGNLIGDVDFGYSQLKFVVNDSALKKEVGSDQYYRMTSDNLFHYLKDKDLLDDDYWNDIVDEYQSYTMSNSRLTYKGIRTNMKYFTYKVYQVDPLTRENLNANGLVRGDDPLLTVRYGCAPEETALKCKLPLNEVEKRIKMIHPEWKGYRAGEMYRIVLEVEEQVGIGEKDAQGSDLNFDSKFDGFGQKLATAKTTTSILFRCFEKAEQYKNIETNGETTYEHKYLGTDFTPVQWPDYPTYTHTIPAGRTHTVEVRNGKTGMTDWECDTRVFDMYYQWWEVDENGKEIKLLAGTDNVFVDGLDKHDERGTEYKLSEKAKHKPGGWDLSYKKIDGKRYQYANTIDPNDPRGKEYYQNDPEKYPNVTGLPKITENGQWNWTAEQIHMYSAETTNANDLFNGSVHSLENNKIFENQTDSCYIPMEMIGKRIRVCVIALNTRWPLAYDKKQTFWSHTMEVCDPNSPEGYLNIKTDEKEDFGEDVPATFSVQKLRDCYDEYNMVCDITYVAYGKYKSFCFDTKSLVTDLSALPTAHYPKDFTDQRPDYVVDNDIFGDVGVVLHFTDKDRLGQVRVRTEDYTTSMITSSDWLTLPPDLYGTFTITPTGEKKEKDQDATFSVTSLKGLNAGETISGIYYYAFGKSKFITGLSVYDIKDLPEARYPAGFTDATISDIIFAKKHGDVFARITTSKGSETYRTVYLTEEKPNLTGTVNITYDKDMSYATYDRPVKISLDDLKDLAYNEAITEVRYKLENRDEEKVFSIEDDPDVFKNGIPSATFPNDFYEEGSAGWNSNRTYTPYVTIVAARKSTSQKSVSQQGTGTDTPIVTTKRTGFGTDTGLELVTDKSIDLGTVTEMEPGTGTPSGQIKTGRVIRKNDDETREETIKTVNNARFQYVVKATSVELRGKEVETFTVSDIQNGKYPYGISAFTVMPPTAKIGYDFTDYTNTNEKVAALDENGNIKLTGEAGDTTISVKSPDGKTVSKTVRVYQDFDSIEISGIKAPVIGEKFDVDSIKVPDDALYHITNVKWEKSRGKTVGADETAAYFEPYTICVTIEPNDFTRVADDFTSRMYETQADGTQELLDGSMLRDFDEETNSYLNSCTCRYTYPAQTNHETKEIDKIYIDFPTEVKEGDNFIQWLEGVHVYTNGYDDGLAFKLTPTYGEDAEKIANAYGFSASSTSSEQLNYFIKGVQNGLKAEITIPENLKETGDAFAAASDIKVYINGEEGGTFIRASASSLTVTAADTLTITDGEFNPPKKPVYSVKDADAVVGEPINVKDLLVTDDPKVTIRPTGIYQGDYWDEYIKYDSKEGTYTPLKAKTSTDVIKLTYMVEYDENGDGYPEYQYSSYAGIEKIYATAADVPKPETPPVQEYGTAKIIVQNPDGKEISKADYKIRSNQGISDPDGMFFIGFCDADGKSVIEANMENGKTYYAKTVAADDMEIHAGVNSAYALIRMPDGKTMSSIHISADGTHYLVGDYLRDLNPDTEYTLYYKHGADGKVYSKTFRTAKQDYGVMIGHDFVTDANLGNLEQDGWHYDADTKTLTLKNFTLNDYGAEAYTEDFLGTPVPFTAAVASKDALTLNLIGDNHIAFAKSDLFTFTVFAEKDLTITGNGNLTLTGNAQYGLSSHTGNICLNSTGTLTFAAGDMGLTAFYPEKGEVLYTNGTIDYLPKIAKNWNDLPYQSGSLIQSKDAGKLNFSGKVHDIKIEAAGLDGKYETVAESDLAALLQKNDDCEYEEEKSAIRITPAHNDVNKIASADTHDSGSCGSGATYHLSCDCGHIGEETFRMSAEAHSLVKHAAKAATCEESGTVEYWECEICGERYADAKGIKPLAAENIVIPALGHKLTHHEAVPATCTKAGVIEYWSCETCGERFADENGTLRIFSSSLTVPATGHDWVQRFAKPATCETDGVIAHWVCSHCGQCSADKDGNKLLKKEDVVIKAFGHKWSEWTVFKAATETAEGEEFRTCSVCGEVETRVIPFKAPETTTTTTTTSTTKPTTTTTATTKATTTSTSATKATTTTSATKTTTTTSATKATTTTSATKATTTTSTTKATTTTSATKVTTTTSATKATTTTSTTKVTTTTSATKATTTTSATKATTTTSATKATTTTSATKATTTTSTTKATTTTSATKATTTTSATKATTTTSATKATTTTSATKATTTTSTTKATTTTSTTKATTTTSTTKATTTTTSATKATTTTPATTTTTTTITTTTVTTTSTTVTSATESTETTVTTSETTPAEPEYLLGDINDDGEVSVEDAQLALLEYVNAMTGLESSLTDKQKRAGDVNGDKEISVEDAQTILLYYVSNTLSGESVTWDDLLDRKPQGQQLPMLMRIREFFLDEEAETDL